MLNLISSLVTNPTALIFLLLILGGLFRKWKVVKRSLWGIALVKGYNYESKENRKKLLRFCLCSFYVMQKKQN